MIDYDLRGRDIRDPRALDAFGRIPRELVLPEKYADNAYDDNPFWNETALRQIFAGHSVRCNVFFLVPAQEYVAEFLATFEEFPPRQKAASFSLDDVMKKLESSGGSK